MSNPSRIPRRAWLAFPALALVFFVAVTVLRVRRVEYVSAAAGQPPEAAAGGAWQPRLIVPGHHNESFEWLDQTRQMFALRQLRVRHIDYEDAQAGRDVYAASPYRWWLGLVALAHHWIAGAALGPSIEWAALWADPLLFAVFGAATVAFVARRFGTLAAALSAAALATLYPLGTEFLPGVPDDAGLGLALASWSVLALLAGATAAEAPAARRWFAAGGALGGLGVWVGVAREVPVLLGIGLGGLIAAGVSRRAGADPAGGGRGPLPWRSWSVAGAVTCLAAYLAEFFPSHMGNWELRAIHPIFGIAWLGGGEAVARASAWAGGERRSARLRGAAAWVLALAAFASLPVAMRVIGDLSFLSTDLPNMSLTLLPGGPAAPSLWAWLLQNGVTAPVWATILPLLLLGPACALLFLRSVDPSRRAATAVALGPVLVTAGFAFRQVSSWNGVDATWVALLVAVAFALDGLARAGTVAWLSSGFAVLVLSAGAWRLWVSAPAWTEGALSEGEVIGLVERDLAYWLAKRVGPAEAVVLAPPNETATLYYYGGLRGLGTFGWEDRDGLQAAVRIMSASTPEEAQELIGRHGVTQIVLPLWDPYMDTFAQIGAGQLEGTFLARIHKWNLPPWLRPVPYLIPSIAGFEGQNVIILEVVDEQDDATALSNIAVYLAEMGQLDLAAKAGHALRRFPADLGALLAQAQVQIAVGQTEDFASSVTVLVRRLATGADRDLPWDKKVALAVVLAQAGKLDLARTELQKCLKEVDADKLRSLSTGSLFRLQILRRAVGLEFADPEIRSLSLQLLPVELRGRVE